MKEVITIINNLREISGTNDKIQILKDNKDNDLLQKVLEYTYNPFKKYGISENLLEDNVPYTNFTIDIFGLLDILSESNINNSLRATTNSFISSIENYEERELYKCMLFKDLKIGINSKTINKVWKGLIPQFNVMLADKYFEKQQKVKNKEFIITQKLDGARFILIKDNNGNVKYYTRQGQEVTGLIEFENDIKLIPNNTVIDGEVLLNKEGLHSKDLYRETMKEFRKKDEKHGLILHAFDILTFDDFINGISKTPCKIRKEQLHNLISFNSFTNIIEVPIRYIGKNEEIIVKLLDEAINRDEEGVMVNLADAPYECKRTNNILKVKKFQDADLRVLNIIEGTGKNVGKLGSITIQFEKDGQLYHCDCGSGFSDEERVLYYNNNNLLLNKIVTIGYFEISQNSKTKEYSLRFPTWKGIIRNDKAEISMY